MSFWRFIQNKASEEEIDLRIEGDIVSTDDSWFYEWFDIPHASPNKFRTELANHKGKKINVWIDSYGGDTMAAAGIYNALKEHQGKVIVKIDGKAMSAASVIAMAGDEVYMSPVAIMMIHNPWTRVAGDSEDMKHAADILDETKEAIMNAYQSKAKISRGKISEMMDNETWMSAKSAVKEGFADGILYDKEKEEDEEPAMFNRLAVQNSSENAIKRFFELYNEKVKNGADKGAFLMPEKAEMPAPEEGLMNLYKSKIKNNLRRYEE
jgi:ATP-dependent Clp protease protease subunit